MRTSRSTLRSALAAVTVAAAMTSGAATAFADGAQDDPKEDPRAVVHQGNAKKCEQVGVAGHVIDKADLGYKVTPRKNEDRRLTIKSIRDGAKITAIVVKGGPRYNLYVPGELGLSENPPWEDLRAPLNDGGNIAAISHWFACWEPAHPETTDNPPTTDTTTTTPTGTETSTPTTGPDTSTTPGGSETTTPGESTTSSPSSSQPAAPTTTTTTEAAPAVSSGDTENLAYTGFNNAWLIWLGGALVLAGAASLVLLRVRRSRS